MTAAKLNTMSIDDLISGNTAAHRAEVQRRHGNRVKAGKPITPKMARFLGVEPTPRKTPKAEAPKADKAPKTGKTPKATSGFNPMTANWPAVMGEARKLGISIKGLKAPKVRELVAAALGGTGTAPKAETPGAEVGSPEWVNGLLAAASAKVGKLEVTVERLTAENQELRAQLLSRPEPVEAPVEEPVEEVQNVWADVEAAAAVLGL